MITQARRISACGKRPLLWVLAAALLLLAPTIAMQFTDEVHWTASDFLAAAVLIAALGVGVELALRLSKNMLVKATAVLAVVVVFALIWINAAVGLVGSEASLAGWVVVAVISTGLLALVLLVCRLAR